MANVQGTNIKPVSNKELPREDPDPAHPERLLPPMPPMGPYYRQKGANG